MVLPDDDKSSARAELEKLASAAITVLSGFDDRDLRILRERTLAYGRQTTLEELGQSFDLTRERVRQIETSILKKINRRLTFPEHRLIPVAAKSLSEQLGVVFQQKRLDELVSLASSSDIAVSCPDLLPLLLWLGGPYSQDGPWIVKKPVPETLLSLREVVPVMGTETKLYDFQRALSAIGVRNLDVGAIEALCDCRVLGDQVITWRGSLADKAAAILHVNGSPMTREQISVAIPDEHSIRTLGNYLCADKRFVRLNLTEFALAAWGGNPYQGIVQELANEIERTGGEATLDHLKQSLMTRFGVSEHSVVTYLSSPLFARTTRGGFRLRRDEEEIVFQTRIELTRSCFRIDRAWSYRLLIDDELIRGSGRNAPTAFAQSISLSPGESLNYASEVGEYRISWIGPQPTVGSVRRFVERHSLAAGDLIYLVPTGTTLRVFVIRATELLELQGLQRLFRETCPASRFDYSEAQGAIAESIGLDRDSSWSSVKLRFLERREHALFALVPDDENFAADPSELEEFLEYIG